MLRRIAYSFAVIFTSVLAQSAFAAGAAPAGADHAAPGEPLKPARTYDGSAPIDLSNGMIGSNGTFGAPNKEYEAKAQAQISAPGVFAAPYPYSAKSAFVKSVAERLRFFEEAVINLEEGGTMVTPETEQFSKTAGPKIRELLERARDLHKSAKGAGEKDWVNAEQAAHTAFVELKTGYERMMLPSAPVAAEVK